MKFLILLGLLFTASCASTSQVKNEVVSNAYEVSPLLNGASVPNSIVRNIDGAEIDLNKELMGKKSVLVFYRGGWCPYCNLQLQGLRKIEKKLEKLGWSIVGISPDSPSSLKESVKKHDLKYSLYSDSKANAIKAFGLAFKVDDKTNKKYLGYGISLDKASGESHHILPVPGVYLVNQEGKVVFSYVHPNYKVRVKESIILEAAKVLK